MRGPWWLAFAALPAAALAVSASLPGPPAPVPPPPGPAAASAPEVRPPPAEPCADIEPEYISELRDLEWERAERRHEEASWESLVYDSLDECGLNLEVLALDCAHAPCLLLARQGEDAWAHRLAACEPLASSLERPGELPYFIRRVTCADGEVLYVEGTWFDDRKVTPTPGSLEDRVDLALLGARQEALALRTACR